MFVFFLALSAEFCNEKLFHGIIGYETYSPLPKHDRFC